MSYLDAGMRWPTLRSTAVLLTAALLAGCDAGATDNATATPQAVETLTIRLEPSARTWTYVGTVKPRYQSDLGFRVAGKMTSRHVEVGDYVKKDQVIAGLDPADFELALAAQEAELAAATTTRDEAIASLNRFETLFAQGHVSKAALDQRASAAVEARSRFDRAQRNVELARNQLAYAKLASDTAGVVTSLSVEAGQVVAAGQLVAKVARLDFIEVEVALPEQQLEDVRGAIAEVEIWGAGGERLPATLREVAPEADPVSRTFRARFAIADPSRVANLGRTATVYLTARSAGQIAVLPLSAVSNDGTGTVAWVISADGTRATPRKVAVQTFEKDRVIVTSGLTNGERVVALGVHMLDPGKPIRPVQTRAAMDRN